MNCLQRAERIERTTRAIEHASQQFDADRKMAGAITRTAARMRDCAGTRQRLHNFDRIHAGAGHDAFDIALRHQE